MSQCATTEMGPQEWHESRGKFAESPLAIDVRDLLGAERVEQRTNRLIRAAGNIACKASGVDSEGVSSSRTDYLSEAITKASEGDIVAKRLVRGNVAADVTERTIKSGHVRSVIIEVDDNGKFSQCDQLLEQININAINYASNDQKILDRTISETRNFVNAETLYRLGWLDDYYLVVDSPTADDMTGDELDSNHFFKETMSCSFQAMTVVGGELVLQMAFVSGIKKPGDERHDIETLTAMAASEGTDYSGLKASEIIGRPRLIHKSLMPNGVIDRVKLYDDMACGTFFGEGKPRTDYLEYLKTCEERERSYDPVVDKIVAQLVAEEATLGKDPIAAVERLNQLSQEYTLEMSITDKRIDPRVFGATAAPHIEQARLFYQQGRPDMVSRAVNKAQSVASSGSCPSANKKRVDGLEELPGGFEDLSDGPSKNEEKYEAGESDKFGSLEFKCTEGHRNKRNKNELLDECQKKPCKGKVCAPKNAKQTGKADGNNKSNKGTANPKLLSFFAESSVEEGGKRLVKGAEAFIAKSSGRLALANAVQ